MVLLYEKLEKRTRDLEAFRYTQMNEIREFCAMEDVSGPDEVHNRLPDVIQGMHMKIGDEFAGYDRYLWLEQEVMLPEHMEGMEVTGIFAFGKTGGGHNSGFESLLYVNREPYQGVDSNHQDVNLEPFAGQTVCLSFMLWTGMNGSENHDLLYHRLRTAEIGYLHKGTDTFYYYAKAIYKTLHLLPDEDPVRQDLAEVLNRAFQLVNWDRDKFYGSIGPALAYLEQRLSGMEKHTPVTVHCIGHTHIDVAWLWRLKHTREKAMRSFSTVLRLMEEADDYRFLQSQPQLYAYMKQDSPELYERIRAKIQAGQWEADGGMWLEADCNISSGEALVRQLLYGIQFMKDEFGKECEYLWLPDVFGYSWALPQILTQCNIKSFVTTKISWNQFNTMPHDLFWWRGIDGSEIMTYFINTPEVGYPETSRFATYNGQLSPRSVLGTWRKFKDKAVSRDTLISYGYGDGGGGVNRNMLKMRRAMDQIPGLPHVKNSYAGEFLRKTKANLEAAGEAAALWDGELYLEYHRGTYTSQAYNKKMNRMLELALAETEWLSVIGALYGTVYEAEMLHKSWECVLRNQFHDIIPGSSIREVYEDSRAEYEHAWNSQAAVRMRALTGFVGAKENHVTLYNFSSFSRAEAVYVPLTGSYGFRQMDGTAAESQKAAGGYLVKVDMEPLSIISLELAEAVQETQGMAAVSVEERRVETPHYELSWGVDGFLDRIYDKEYDREVLSDKGQGNMLEIYEDRPLDYQNWDIDIFHMEKRELVLFKGPAEVLENGSLRTRIRFAYEYNKSKIIQELILYRDNRRIDFETYVDWQEECRLLKTAFETDMRSTKATYDIQYGHVERPTHYNTSWDYARFEVVGHKWADLSVSNYGVSLLNNCKFGYSVKDHIMRLTLLKSTKSPDDTMDMGEHRFTYSILPHAGSVTEGNTIEEAVALNLPVQSVTGKAELTEASLFQITDHRGDSSRAAVIDAVKKAEKENCIIIRLHECRGGAHKLRISSSYPVEKYEECSLLEETTGESVTGAMMEFALKPFEIKTIRVWPGKVR